MLNSKKFTALGLMSGTSADGIDVAIVKTDGKSKIELGPCDYLSFSKKFSNTLKSLFKEKVNIKNLQKNKRIVQIEKEFTYLNFLAISEFLKKKKIDKKKIDVVGFHGQTLSHNPSVGYSWQLGNSKELSKLLNLKVISDFRNNDIKHNGQGAPLTPIFHFYLTKKIKKKICFINLGGISNISYFDHKNNEDLNKIIAFDTGPCCSLLDDWIKKNTNNNFDNLGLFSRKGIKNKEIINKILENSFFNQTPPKSLDRSFFSLKLLKKLNLNDGAATLSNLIAETLFLGLQHLPDKPDLCILSGGGRLNKYLVERIKYKLNNIKVNLTENYKWNGDFIEAHAFAYLSVRSLLKLPITFPKTTGVKKPLTGGRVFFFSDIA